jgi:ComF family protein
VIEDFISLLFPRYCLVSGTPLAKGEQFMTTSVVMQLPRHDLDADVVAQKFYGKVALQHAFAYYKFIKNGNVQKILHALKYRNCPELGIMLGGWFGYALKEAGYTFDILIPVPLHRTRLRQRGYNQSDKIAEGMAAVMETPWADDIVVRTQKTITQTGKDRIARFENVSNIFSLEKPEAIKGKRVLVIDDVVTTGSTLEACIMAISEGNCESLSVAALASAI